jgi:nucleoside 2-deoxyribosyltransferase
MTLKVYLAGGFHSSWQRKVKDALSKRTEESFIPLLTEATKLFEFYDPSQHQLKEARNYTSWDLSAVTASDIVFANMEAANPAGYATAAEIGVAFAQGKTIVWVDDLEEQPRSRYFDMVREMATYKFRNLDTAIDFMVNTFPADFIG